MPAISPSLSDEEINQAMGFPDDTTLEGYKTVHQRAVERKNKFFNPTGFVKPINPDELSEEGKAYRQNQARLNQEPSQLDSILGRLEKTVRVTLRQPALSFSMATLVVKRIFELELQRKNKGLWLTAEQRAVLEDIIRYFIGDPQSPYPLHKGLFVYGGYGVGKTFLFRAMQTLCSVTPIPDMDFAEVSTKTFVTAWKNFKESKEKKANPAMAYSRGNLLLDDLGEEPQRIVAYTNTENPIDELLSERYIAFDRFGHLTHVTSNLGLGDSENALEEQLTALYGSRILDRFHDMFTVVLLPGESKRG